MSAREPLDSASSGGALRRFDATGLPALAARLVLGGLFIKMGWSKVAAPDVFLKLINEYQMVPPGAHVAMNLLAIVLPYLEVFCGVLLILGMALRGTALLLAVMLIGFTGVVTMRAMGIHAQGGTAFCDIKFDCGCGSGEVFICRKILENTGLTLLSLFLLWSRPVRKWFSLRPCLVGRLRCDRPSVSASSTA